MSNENYIKLSIEKIRTKSFAVELKGYKVEEVDSFLDIIISDYKIFNEEKEKLTVLNKRMKTEIDNLNLRLKDLQANLKNSEEQQNALAKQGVTNASLIKRLAKVESKIDKK